MRPKNFPAAPIHRTTKTNPDCLDAVDAEQFRQHFLDLLANARSAFGGIDRQSSSFPNRCRLIANNRLQLGAADLDPEINLFHFVCRPRRHSSDWQHGRRRRSQTQNLEGWRVKVEEKMARVILAPANKYGGLAWLATLSQKDPI